MLLDKDKEEKFYLLLEDKKICLVIRKYSELTGEGESDKKWIKYWKEKVLSSQNFQRCYFLERSIWHALFNMARDDKFNGKLVYPEGRPMSLSDIIDRLHLPPRTRTDHIKRAIWDLVSDKQMVLVEETDNNGLIHPTFNDTTDIPPDNYLSTTSTQKNLNSQLKKEIRPLISPSYKIKIEEKEYIGPDALSYVLELWNRTTKGILPSIIRMTSGRRTKLIARIREQEDGNIWREIITRIINTPFLRGENDRGWKADLDWLIRNPENMIRIMEGKYDNTKKTTQQQPPPYTEIKISEMSKVAKEFKTKPSITRQQLEEMRLKVKQKLKDEENVKIKGG